MDYIQYIIPVLALSALCAGWVVVQMIARKMKTKNHFDHLGTGGCTNCTCGGVEVCENEK
ncbi:MAG: hypothetical protein CL840_18840 [Crocinitomicaceae bacterium]|nr:hypothetical protein [Crocinitomicaceae bacterium]|tara:strand:+ start:6175 stop:6354 length:180 start_codon:yes stop_codon:yes gene_type:complete